MIQTPLKSSEKSTANTQRLAGDPQAPELLEQVRNRIRALHYSIRTVSAYLDWIRRYIPRFGKRHPPRNEEKMAASAAIFYFATILSRYHECYLTIPCHTHEYIQSPSVQYAVRPKLG